LTDKDTEDERKERIGISIDKGVQIEMANVEIYGLKLGNIKLDLRDERVQVQEVINKRVESETLRLLQEVCDESDQEPEEKKSKKGKK
jgi:hypothetical protein